MATVPVFLKDKSTGETVSAELSDVVSDKHMELVEKTWWPIIDAHYAAVKTGNKASAMPENIHWNWPAKIARIKGMLAYRSFVLTCEGQVQGLMQINTASVCRLPAQIGKHLAYVEYVETAPWNRLAMVASPRFAGVGVTMIRAAIAASDDEGFHGRVGLHSLPQADEFYAKVCGMSDLGQDATLQNLRYFEMTPERAVIFTT